MSSDPDYVKHLLGNAITGTTVGLHTAKQLDDFRAQALAWRSAATTRLKWREAVAALRYNGKTSDGRYRIVDSILPLHASSSTGHKIGSGFVHNVIPFTRMWSLVSSKDKSLPQFAYVPDMPEVPNTKELEKLDKALKGIPKKQRHFEIESDKPLGHPTLWITSDTGHGHIEEGYKSAKKANTFGGTRADWYCAVLGLGHRVKGQFLMVLHIPAPAVDLAGHFRPNFCEAHDFPWFMLGSSVAANRNAGPWGQTADLKALLRHSTSIDGAPERVSRQIFLPDFTTGSATPPLRIHFDILGQVTHDAGSDTIRTDLAKRIWRDKQF
jgi:hypothetical protein